jgi:hypothetical protein
MGIMKCNENTKFKERFTGYRQNSVHSLGQTELCYESIWLKEFAENSW